MLCEIYVFATHDLNPMEEFPQEYSAWADGGPVSTYLKSGELSRQKFTGIEQTRTVTTEGSQSPVHAFLNVQPPKYPPHQLTGYRCDNSIIGDIEAHAEIVVYAVDTVDPADYDSLPAALKGMRPDDPIKDEAAPENIWTKVRNGLINVTPAEHQEQVTTALDQWREQNPEGTAREFGIALRTFTS